MGGINKFKFLYGWEYHWKGWSIRPQNPSLPGHSYTIMEIQIGSAVSEILYNKHIQTDIMLYYYYFSGASVLRGYVIKIFDSIFATNNIQGNHSNAYNSRW